LGAASVSVRGLTKSYGGPPVLEDLDLTVAAGEIVAVMGRSGSGKSTLLKLAGALDTPDAGIVEHDGRDLSSLTDHERTMFRRRSLGFVFQFFNLIPTLNAEENVTLPLTLNGWRPEQAAKRVSVLFEQLELRGTNSKMPDQLSGGEQQRVAIARALAHRPSVIIADEPTGNLDDDTAAQTLELLRSIAASTPATLLMATHSDEAARFAGRIVRLRNGRITAD